MLNAAWEPLLLESRNVAKKPIHSSAEVFMALPSGKLELNVGEDYEFSTKLKQILLLTL